jgi:alkylated DNA repair dioxygenase AlkB
VRPITVADGRSPPGALLDLSGYRLAMRQGDLFPVDDPAADAVRRVELPDAELFLFPRLLSPQAAAAAFAALRRDVDFEQEVIAMYGRAVAAPRLTAWYGDPGCTYRYSGVLHQPRRWMPTLNDLRTRVEAATGQRFNGALVNYYRDGMDSVSWHSDDESDLVADAVIASLSLGAARVFQLRHKTRTELRRVDIELPPGSLLVMGGVCQRHWQHQLPKRKNLRAGRINLTFRQVRVVGLG